MWHRVSPYKRQAVLLLGICSLLSACTGQETVSQVETAVPRSGAVVTHYPYFNDFELKTESEKPDAAQQEWHLGNEWAFVSEASHSPDWHLDFGKPGKGLGSFTEGTARLNTVIVIPDVADAPTLQFWHQLHLEKDSQYVVVEAQIVENDSAPVPQDENGDSNGWFVLRRFYEADNTEEYRRIAVDLTPYIGKALRFRFRTVERSEQAEQSSLGEPSADSPVPTRKESPGGKTISRNIDKRKDKDQRSAVTAVTTPKKEEAKEAASPAKPFLRWRIDDVSVNELDTDGDGIGDSFERRVGTDPNNPNDVPADTNHDGIPDLINGLMGVWNGTCRYVGGGEYLRESFEITEFVFQRRYESSGFDDCRTPWNTISKHYGYSLSHVEELANTGAQLDLTLRHIVVVPDNAAVAQSLNRACSKHDFVALAENVSDGVTCSGGVVYPKPGVVHYDVIREEGRTLWVGDRLDETDPAKRASTYAYDAAFKKAGT